MGAEESKPEGGGPPSRESVTAKSKLYLLNTVLEHCGAINCMALSEDESILATGSDDRSVRLWMPKTPRCDCIGILSGHEGYVTCVAIDEIHCLSGSVDRTVRKWDMATCTCLAIYEGHGDRVNRLFCTGDFVFSTSSDATMRCWDMDDGRCIRTFTGHSGGVFPLHYVVADDTLDVDESSVPENGRPASMPKICDLIVTGSTDCTARSWSFETAKTVNIFRGHTGPITCIGTDVDDRILLTSSTDGSVRTWDFAGGQPLSTFEGHRMPIICMTIADWTVFTGSSDCTARGFTFGNKSLKIVYRGHQKPINCIKHVDNLLFTGDDDGIVLCFDTATAEVKRIFAGPANVPVNAIQVVDGRLFVGCGDSMLRIYTLRGVRHVRPSLKPVAATVAAAQALSHGFGAGRPAAPSVNGGLESAGRSTAGNSASGSPANISRSSADSSR